MFTSLFVLGAKCYSTQHNCGQGHRDICIMHLSNGCNLAKNGAPVLSIPVYCVLCRVNEYGTHIANFSFGGCAESYPESTSNTSGIPSMTKWGIQVL